MTDDTDVLVEAPPRRRRSRARLKYPQHELFTCDLSDVIPKDIMPMMEHPFFTLEKNLDVTTREYTSPDGRHYVKVVPSAAGFPNIWDKDLLMFVVSQVMQARNNGGNPERDVWIQGRDYLKFTNRGLGGRDYDNMEDTILRLKGVTIETNIGGEGGGGLARGLIDEGDTLRSSLTPKQEKEVFDRKGRPHRGRMRGCKITISKWLWEAIERSDVLSISSEYFTLTKALERRLYEICRKHIGAKAEFRMGMDLLRQKSGSTIKELWQFRYEIKKIVYDDRLPQYSLAYDAEKDQVVFRKKDAVEQKAPSIGIEALDEASLYVTDPAERIEDWLKDWIEDWRQRGCEHLYDPDAAFKGWCKARWLARRKKCQAAPQEGFIEKHTDKSWREGL